MAKDFLLGYAITTSILLESEYGLLSGAVPQMGSRTGDTTCGLKLDDAGSCGAWRGAV